MTRPAGVPNTLVRWDPVMEEFRLQCRDCRARGVASYWPLTREFWEVGKGMARCRACWNERRNRADRVRRQTDPVYAEREREANRQARREMGRIWYAQRWERSKADPEKHQADLDRRRAQTREATRRYRAKRREMEMAA